MIIQIIQFFSLLCASYQIEWLPKWVPLIGAACNIHPSENTARELQKNLTKTLHGQHLVISPLVAVLERHLNVQTPEKALVLSLHGSPGVGKNFVSKKIVHHIFEKGFKSPYVHYFSGTGDFNDPLKLREYNQLISDTITNSVSSCPNSIFIFDEADKMVDGLFDTLRPFVDYLDNYKNVDFRKSIFIFLSNIGGVEVNKLCFLKTSNGISRDQFQFSEFSKLIKDANYNSEGGLKMTSLIKNHLVDLFLPFLPLERHHILACVTDSMRERRKQSSKSLEDFVLNEITFLPDGRELYSSSGCKGVDQAVSRFFSLQEWGRDEL